MVDPAPGMRLKPKKVKGVSVYKLVESANAELKNLTVVSVNLVKSWAE